MAEKQIIVFDLDGTLADFDHRRVFDADGKPVAPPNEKWTSREEFEAACVDDREIEPIMELFRYLDFCNAETDLDEPEVWTSRSFACLTETADWLNDRLRLSVLRHRPRDDHRLDAELKQQWVKEVGAENILFAIDDREDVCEMFQRNGVLALRVYKP